jgi:hypothetical protein
VVSFEREPIRGLLGSSPRSLASGVGVEGPEEAKGSERGSIPPTASKAYKAL